MPIFKPKAIKESAVLDSEAQIAAAKDEIELKSEIPGFDDAERNEKGKLNLSTIFAGYSADKEITSSDELRKYQPYPELKSLFNEYFDITDNHTRTSLISMNEAQHNAALSALTSKLYDQVVSKANSINFGEIPKTKGDITKLSNFENMKDCIAILKGIVSEYKQDSKPIDDVAIAITNIQGRRDMFNRAFSSKSDMPILMYNSMVMACVVGVSHMITATIEFIKAPKDESFIIQLDKVAYNKSKDHLIYSNIAKFNRMCENGEFDKTMNDILDKKIRKGHNEAAAIATGAVLAGKAAIGLGVAIAAILIITNIIPILRELVYFFFHSRVVLSDYFETQADLLAMNAYNLEYNDINTPVEVKKDIIKKQNSFVMKFRRIANAINIKDKKAEVNTNREIQNSTKQYVLDKNADIVAVEPNSSSVSALF